MPLGGYAMYGLLGIFYEQTNDGVITVEVPYTDAEQASWESLAGRIDVVHLGLLREFSKAVLDSAISVASRRFPPGRITVVEAACGRGGSNAVMFSRLAASALELMLDGQHTDETHLAELLKRTLLPSRQA